MSRLISLALGLAIASMAHAEFAGIGRAATPDEIKAWDIDVRADFKGLPAGSGSVAKGQDVWDAKCASCHGTFGESNAVFPPIVGGTTKEDVERGRVAALVKGNDQRTTLMKLSSLGTLFDYIRRAMPWNAPKTLTDDEVYAVIAYILNLGDLVPADFVLSDANIRDVQKRLPNRDGMTREHGLWTVNGKPDTQNKACMKDCEKSVAIHSQLPDAARDAHGNLADQNRLVGPVRGIVTSRVASAPKGAATQELASNHGCLACHAQDRRVVGPSFDEVAARYRTQAGSDSKLAAKIRAGGGGAWGETAMPPSGLDDGQALELARWILTGSK